VPDAASRSASRPRLVVDARGHREGEAGALVQRLRERVELLRAGAGDGAFARREIDVGEIVAAEAAPCALRVPAVAALAACQRREQRERRGHGLCEQVAEHLGDERADLELRIASEPVIGSSSAISPLESFSRFTGEEHRQLGRLGLSTLSPNVRRSIRTCCARRACRLDVVLHVERELAVGDAVARVALRVRGELGQLDALALGRRCRRRGRRAAGSRCRRSSPARTWS
jgi:hypothetical protein